MSEITKLRELLAVYFDLTDKPSGAQLLRNELTLEEWVELIIKDQNEMIPELEGYIKDSHTDYKKRWQRRLESVQYKIDTGKKWLDEKRK